MTRRTRAAALGLLAAVVLSGCVRVTSDTSLGSDDTFSQELIFALNDAARAQVGDALGGDVDALAQELKASEALLDLQERYPGQVVMEDYTEGDLTGFRLSMTTIPLSEYEAGASDVSDALPVGAGATVVREGDVFVVTLTPGAGADGLASMGITEQQLGLLAGSVDVGVTFAFPGLVQSATAGTVEGKTVTLGLADLIGSNDIVIIGGATDAIDWSPWLLWGGVSLAVLVIVGGATTLVVQDKRRGRRTDLPPPEPEGSSGIGTLS